MGHRRWRGGKGRLKDACGGCKQQRRVPRLRVSLRRRRPGGWWRGCVVCVRTATFGVSGWRGHGSCQRRFLAIRSFARAACDLARARVLLVCGYRCPLQIIIGSVELRASEEVVEVLEVSRLQESTTSAQSGIALQEAGQEAQGTQKDDTEMPSPFAAGYTGGSPTKLQHLHHHSLRRRSMRWVPTPHRKKSGGLGPPQ